MSVWPPKTDNGGQPPFKYPFSFAHRSVYGGGWTRQVTVRDFAISIKMAGVQMRLIRGGVRELHWHVQSEWAYTISGTCRITAVDQEGRAFIDDVSAGDLWLFPGGIPHSIQGIGKEGCFFLLVFNDGNFNEFTTFLLSDWMRHIPKDVLAKNFEVPASTFGNLTHEELYIFPAQLPRSLLTEQQEVSQETGFVPETYAFFASQMPPNVTRLGGEVRIVDARNFPITSTGNISAAIVTLKPGGLRELHWHPNDDEWTYFVKGKARMGVFAAAEMARTMNFQEGDVGYIPISQPHWIENIGDEDVIFLEVFPTRYFEDVSLAQWLAHTPSRLVNQHISTGEAFITSIEKFKAVIRPL
ncbi:oxalate decarboxylase OxdD-like [Oppia nitens]|uniref:oxalate decarboxylase OxdD-like n=1 Tax=Oppia nitens TaxID=1686743 RepID=UPI0023DBEA61|nr:oxalate decarboxylase OxdD-like [Oppia nitens]